MHTDDDIYILSRKDVFRIENIVGLLSQAIWEILDAKRMNPPPDPFEDIEYPSGEEQILQEIDLLHKELQAENPSLS
jgi:hypothetical protein